MAECVLHASSIAAMTTIASARRDWEEGRRRFAEAARRDPERGEVLHRQREAVLEELRRRVGATYTLAALAATYGDAERWVLEAVERHGARAGWSRTAALAGDAAFHAYSLGAQDYVP